MNDHGRPNPESLLRAVKKINDRKGQGRLRVFLGMCPGVGKTYAMLKAAKEQQTRGLRVEIGVVETHGRRETEELVAGLKVIPKISTEYKGTRIHEMDLDFILLARPDLVLVDELAHTNVPGSRHLKRYQDVQELLASGIDVYTTLNIQHLESRRDQVAQITGVAVQETVPDSFLEIADQIEMIDLSPSELLYRLKEGKVYLGERAERAAANFFKVEALTALRELALRFTAEKVDQDLNDQMTMKGIEGPWNINERLLVAVSYSPSSARLIRAARRMAYNLEAPWIALYVDTGETLRAEDQDTLLKNLALARELGAEVITMADRGLKDGLQRICRDRNVTQIIMGRPDKRFFKDLLSRGTLLDQLVSSTSRLDVHVIRAERQPRYRGFRLHWPQFKTGFFPYYNTAWFLGLVSFFCYAALPWVGYQAIGPVFLLAILGVSALTGRGPIFFAAMVSALVWDYFFIPPQFTFAITSSQDFMMVLSFWVTALVGGFLTSRIRRQEEILEVREARSRGLYELGKHLSAAKDPKQIAAILGTTIEKQFGGKAKVLLAQRDGKLDLAAHTDMDEKQIAVATWVFENTKKAGWSTPTLNAADCLCLPLQGNSSTAGVLALYPEVRSKDLTLDQESFMEAVIRQVALALERLKFSDEAQAAKLYATSEKLHETLLNSISHEMRTPLTIIIGSASALATTPDPRQTAKVAGEILRAGDRLNRVIENLLDMSRLNSGILGLKTEWCDVHDLVQSAVQKLGPNLGPHRFVVQLIEPLPLVKMDFRLIEHALANVLLNAANYSPIDTPIGVSAQMLDPQTLEISVEDEGKGIPESSREKIFDKFYRVPGTPTGGMGLGLSIVKGIFEAHHGRVWADQATRGGAKFVMRLPVTPAPPVPEET